jgi:hypothetical protein
MASSFDRALNDDFIKQLQAEAGRGGWWADVLADDQLIIGLRRTYLNVYWRGQSLFRVESASSGLRVTTHAKYLVDPALASQVTLTDRDFGLAILAGKGFIPRYEGPRTIEKMKQAAGLHSGLEKTGCHEIAVRNDGFIDCEIAFPGKVPHPAGGDDKQAPRIDIAAVERSGKDARLVFWEAKDYGNGELRAKNGRAAVLRQMGFYRDYLTKHRQAIELTYTAMAKNLASLRDMGWKRALSPVIADVASGKRTLTLGAEPVVGLVIFGFDSAQRDHAGWKTHHDRLKQAIVHVCSAGDAENLRLAMKRIRRKA